MNHKAFEVFGKIHAGEDLKEKTTSYLRAEIEKRAKKRKMAVLRTVVCAVSLALFFLCGGLFFRAYFTPVAYIDFDVNPSVEFRVNRFARVIGVHAYNDDGEEILEYIHVNHQDYAKAAKLLLDAMEEEGYLEQDVLLCITVQTNEGSREESMLEDLQELILRNSEKQNGNIVSEVYAVTEDIKNCAAENRVSPAKYLAIEELIAVDPEADFETCREHSVHELREMVQERCSDGEWHGGEHNQEEHSGLQDSQEQEDSGKNGWHHGWSNEGDDGEEKQDSFENTESTESPGVSQEQNGGHGHGKEHHH